MTRAFIIRIAALVLIGVSLGFGGAYAVSRSSRDRLAQLDRFCASRIVDLRTQSEFIRSQSRKRRVTSEHVENLMHVIGEWVYFRICTSDEIATAYERDVSKCTIGIECAIADERDMSKCVPAFECVAAVLEKLADAMDDS